MSPFDLPGPQFLIFYLILGGVLTAFLWIFRHHGEQGKTVSAPELTDPYLVACLRAGSAEVWRLATIRLIDRGLMKADGATISVVADAKPEDLPNEVERATLEWFRTPQDAISLIKESSSLRLRQLVSPYEERLIELGLLPGSTANRGRYVAAACALALVAIIKIFIALDRGHKNIGFLIILAAVGLFVLYKAATPVRTLRGQAVLEDLKKLFSRLHQPDALQPGKSSAEVMWMAAVYGVGALALSHVEKLYPKGRSRSSCSSSCGASCGSSCGGGGCGGGCGGCGG
jgi:uncharacterized protein (TIGR04222 family)